MVAAVAATLAATLLLAGGCRGRRAEREADRGATSAVVRAPAAGATASSGGELGPAAYDTSLVPPRSPDSTGKFGPPGYGFKHGGKY